MTWTRVFSGTLAEFPSCGIQGITCYGNGRMFASSDRLSGTPSENGFFPVRSLDNGQTWAKEAIQVSLDPVPLGRLRSTGFNTILMGESGTLYDPQWSIIARTVDGALTWASRFTQGQFDALIPPPPDGFFDIMDFIQLDPLTILAVGNFGNFPPDFITYTMLRSIDGGVTFGTPTAPNAGFPILRGGVNMGGGIVLLYDGRTPLVVHRSTDGGFVWTPVALPPPNTFAEVFTGTRVGPLGSQVVVVGGYAEGNGRFYRSTDAGETWSLVAAPTCDIVEDMIAPSASLVVAAMRLTAAQITAGARPFVLSEDGGVTFADLGTYATALTAGANYLPKQCAMADDGAILVSLQTTNTASIAEIWRGVIDGFSGPGPCVIGVSSAVVTTILSGVNIPPPGPEPPPPPPPNPPPPHGAPGRRGSVGSLFTVMDSWNTFSPTSVPPPFFEKYERPSSAWRAENASPKLNPSRSDTAAGSSTTV